MFEYAAAKAISKTYNRVVKGDSERWRNDAEYRSKRRFRNLGVVAVSASVATGVALGFPKMLDNINFVESETTVDGGTQELVKFDLESELHCWTASTIQIKNASAKDETRIAGVSTGWKETKTNFQVEQRICKDETTLRAEFDPNTDHLTINIDDKDVIRTETNIIPGSAFNSVDQTPSYVLTDTITKTLESLPILEDTAMAKNLALVGDIQENQQLTVATLAGMKAAKDNCEPMITKLSAPAVETGLKNIYLPGMNVYLEAQGQRMDPANITVLVEGQPIRELDVIGETSNIDEAYKKLVELHESNENFTFSSGDKSDCKPSAEVQKQIDEAERENSSAGRT